MGDNTKKSREPTHQSANKKAPMQTRNTTSESTQTNDEASKQAMLDYVEGVYEADPTRIERSVNSDLAKRGFFVNEEGATESIMSFAEFIEHTKTYNKDGQFPLDSPKEIIIYEILDHTASAKLIAAWGIDYMHLAKYDDRWMIACPLANPSTERGIIWPTPLIASTARQTLHSTTDSSPQKNLRNSCMTHIR